MWCEVLYCYLEAVLSVKWSGVGGGGLVWWRGV